MVSQRFRIGLLFAVVVSAVTLAAAATRAACAGVLAVGPQVPALREGAGEGVASSSIAQWIIPIIIIVAVVAWRAFLLLGERRSSAGVTYGPAGGAVCPKCGRAFSRSVWSPNLVAGKLSRCPHCGGWSIVARASREALESAEASQAPASPLGAGEPGTSAEHLLRTRIEDSRFEQDNRPRS